jgi:hypothetical protein
MPQTMTVLDRMASALDDLDKLFPRLAHLLPHADTGGARTGVIGRHAPEGSEPWNVSVSDALWGPWFGLGHLINALRRDLGMRQLAVPPRGPDAVEVLRGLIPGCTEEILSLPLRRVERWLRRAGELPAIDESEPWTGLPNLPQTGTPPECPYCGTLALRMRLRAGEIRCFFPDCVDGDERPTRARMEPGRMTGEARMVFGDGTMMAWQGDDAAA